MEAQQVSIHAPEGGATRHARATDGPCACFNPRSRGGSDWDRICASDKAQEFQSTLPRGERRRARMKIRLAEAFQSTLPRGERLMPHRSRRRKTLFQSTLPRGERRGALAPPGSGPLFQSTLPRGERPCSSCTRPASPSFNPRSRGGSDGISVNLILPRPIAAPASAAALAVRQGRWQYRPTGQCIS